MTTYAREFKTDAKTITRDLDHRARIQKALRGYETKRDENQLRYGSYADARQAASDIKYEAVNHLDQYLVEFTAKLEARGAKVFWAETAEDARDYILQIAREKNAKALIKSKTMTSEEIHLNSALQEAGFGVVESDLGEFNVQLRDEAPYHLVFPAMHLTRDEVSQTFQDKLGSPAVTEPEALTMIAREQMRLQYCTADIGISGANFAVAETGMISITENEGNARLTTSLPKVHIALLGIEKVLPKMSDLALFLPLLATSGAGQLLTGYNTLIGGPKQDGENDGPEEFHVVLLDNGRTELLADPEQRDALHCIRCGACLNVCPIFKNVGGHTYGTTYQGPIGSVITPHLRGLQDWKHLSFASSLCGACTQACPVKIDLHHHLLRNRRNASEEKPVAWEKALFKVFAQVMNNPGVYRMLTSGGKVVQRLHPLVKSSAFDPMREWTKSREFPPVAKQTFREWWEKEGRN